MSHYKSYEAVIPKYIIIGLDKELAEFREVLEGVTIPDDPLGLYVEQIIETIILIDDKAFEKMIQDIIKVDNIGLGLYDRPRIDEYEVMLLNRAALLLGTAIKNKILQLGLLLDGHIAYLYYGVLNKNAVVMELNKVYENDIY